MKKNASWTWQSLMGAKEEVKKGARQKIGNGKSIRLWEDAWIQDD